MQRPRRQFLLSVARVCPTLIWLGCILGLLLLGALPARQQQAAAQGSALTFGLFGDLAYSPAEEPLLQNVLNDHRILITRGSSAWIGERNQYDAQCTSRCSGQLLQRHGGDAITAT